jgi:hypothetical protein
MIQTVGHRGLQPPDNVSPSTRPKAGKRKPEPYSGSPATAVRFGGGIKQSLLNGSVNTFQNITEVFLYGFLAQDMLAMWLPRVWSSLQVGKHSYDPNQDPKMKDKPFGAHMKAWLTANWKGLNWVNFFEETKREVATGPGLLAVPALAFVLNRAMANPAIELSASSIETLGEGLKTHLKEHCKDKTYTSGQKKEFIQDAKAYLKRLFADTDFAKQNEQSISDWIESEVESSFEHVKKQGVQRLGSKVKKAFSPEKESEALSLNRKKLDTAIWEFNKSHRINKYDLGNGVIEDTNPLNNRGKTWVSHQPDALKLKVAKAGHQETQKEAIAESKNLVKQVQFAEVQNDVSRIGGYLNKIWDNFEKAGHVNIGDATEKTMKELTRNKWLFGGGVTLLTAAYLVRLAFWSQNHDSYQATRLLVQDASKKNHPHSNRQQQSNPIPPQAGLPFGSQPAFSQFVNNVPVRPPVSLNASGFIQPGFNPMPFSQSPSIQQTRFQNKRVEGGQV